MLRSACLLVRMFHLRKYVMNCDEVWYVQFLYFTWSPCVILYFKRRYSKRKARIVAVFINTDF
jgi:hypothetical protein